MPITSAMNSAISGLHTSQAAIDVISQNISNVNTQGYTKKVYQQSSVVLNGAGMGAKEELYTRNVDEGLIKDLRQNAALLSNLMIKDDFMSRVETLFGEPGSSADLSNEFNSIVQAFENLASNPADLVSQSNTINTISSALSRINNLGSQLQSMRQEADKQLTTLCNEVNDILSQIDSLNDNIVRTQTLGNQSTADYEDQMDQLMLRLSEIMDVQYFKRSSGEIVITTSSGDTLLDNDPQFLNHTNITTSQAWTTYSGGNIGGIYLNGKDITSSLKTGEMSALVELRDSILPEMQASLDEMSSTFAEQMNILQNRSTSFPDMQSSFTGDRTFIASDTQTISISDGDVKIALFDSDGKQAFTTSLVDDLGFTSGTIDDLASTLENWLRTDPNGPLLAHAKVEVNSEGKFTIDLGTSTYGLGIIDEASSTPGSTQQDVTISFDANGDGVNDSTHQGFSYFLGLNNLITTNTDNWCYDSKIMSAKSKPQIQRQATISFSMAGDMDMATVDILPGDTLAKIAERINSTEALKGVVKATLVQEGSGYRLRIENTSGEHMEITEKTNTGLLSQLGLEASKAGTAEQIELNSFIKENPSALGKGMMQFDAYSGEYFLSASDNSIASQFTSMLTEAQSFSEAGFMSSGSATFAQYAASFVSQVANDTAANNSKMIYQDELTSTISYKSAEISSVNLDEELATLTIYERSYAAAAKVISTTIEMLDDLFAAV
ncbi:MAG: flagellar hook-associated protein FlgK [Alphaproteobacteria bacterium]|nr:flagellar hook-associated protein FlgK [Alphaproteobacteria bacterium]